MAVRLARCGERCRCYHRGKGSPRNRTIAQYTLQDGCYGEAIVLREGDTLTCPLFPGVACPVAQIFAGLP